MVTEAMPSALRSWVPAKMTSSMRVPRRLFADCSPRTQLMAAVMLDLPQPFGPTIPAMPSPWKRSSVRSQKDLNPCSSMRLSLSKALSSASGGVVTILNARRRKVKHIHHSQQYLFVNPHNILGGVSFGVSPHAAPNDGHFGARLSRNARMPS